MLITDGLYLNDLWHPLHGHNRDVTLVIAEVSVVAPIGKPNMMCCALCAYQTGRNRVHFPQTQSTTFIM